MQTENVDVNWKQKKEKKTKKKLKLKKNPEAAIPLNPLTQKVSHLAQFFFTRNLPQKIDTKPMLYKTRPGWIRFQDSDSERLSPAV